MKKRYKAKSDVSINVSLPSGKNLHIAFSPITNGGSVYYTDVEDVQKGLEDHSKFGKLFRLDESFDENAE